MLLRGPLDNDSRVKKEIQSLTQSGHEVFIVSVNSKNVNNIYNYVHKWDAKRRVFPGISAILSFFSFLLFSLNKYKDHRVIHCHDLNTLPTAVLIKFLNFKKKIDIVYDSHELAINDVPNEKKIRKAYKFIIELFFIRFCKKVICVGNLIGQKYSQLYKIELPSIILNCPPLETSYNESNSKYSKKDFFREKFKIKPTQKIFLYQGLLNKGRCIEMWLDVFKHFNHNDPVIVFMGYGDLKNTIKACQAKGENIFYHDAVSPEVILDYSSSADIGISCFEGNLSESLRLSLPNKLFEYMMAGLPVIVSSGPEMVKIVQKYQVGFVLHSNNTKEANGLIEEIKNNDLTFFPKNLYKASLVFNWENQSKVLNNIYNGIKI